MTSNGYAPDKEHPELNVISHTLQRRTFFTVSKAEKRKREEIERFVVEAVGKITDINSSDIPLRYRFESDLCMGYAERTNLSRDVHAKYDVQIALVQYPEDKTVRDFIGEIMDNLK